MSMPTSAEGTNPRTWAIVVWVLYLLAFVTFVSLIIGVIIAYVKRDGLAGTPYESHMVSAIRTFWISLIVGIIGALLTVVGVGFVILVLLALWQLFRSVRGLIRAIDGQPIENPESYL
jgi:uncharacterized membrane protein